MPDLMLFAVGIESDATLSADGTYRYRLSRYWNPDRPRVNFVMLNPSTADASCDDPTIRRCIGFAHSWGCGGLVVTNLFALRATDPKELAKHPDPVGPENDLYLRDAASECSLVVCAWGAHRSVAGHGDAFRRTLAELGRVPHMLRLTKDGMPQHPLYLPADLKPIPWEIDHA